jgi:putative acetyltransferase
MLATNQIARAGRVDFAELTEVWEASVRATHHFLTEDYIQIIRPLLLHDYLGAVRLYCTRDTNEAINGFVGVLDGKVEMLFVHPSARGQGLGTLLMRFAIENLGVTAVDVNEQNESALGFYRHLGFRVKSRSPLDGMGKPYPILHLELAKG